MVFRLLKVDAGRNLSISIQVTFVVLLLLIPVWASNHKKKAAELSPSDILLQDGRKLSYERSFGSEREVHQPGFWGKLVDFVAGEPTYHELRRPYSIAVDSRGRAIITDPGAKGIHIFDFARRKYKFIERKDNNKDAMRSPQCVAVDAEDNIYVTDSEAGKIFVFDSAGKFQRAIGSLKGGEGFFKRPTGIAVDSLAQRIYVTDTLRDNVFILDLQGEVIKTIGQRGNGNLEFNLPTELRLHDRELVVVDAMNFRIQFLELSGAFRSETGQVGDTIGSLFRPKGIGIDSENHLYIVDGLGALVQVFDRAGQLLYYFGGDGTEPGKFRLPAGLFIDKDDRIFIVDSYNRRVQVFRYYGLTKQAHGERR